MKNEDLKQTYSAGELKFRPGFNESQMLVDLLPNWQDRRVLEIGCGTGDLAAMMMMAGARSVLGIDYAEGQIEKAKEKYSIDGLQFDCIGYKTLDERFKFDTVVMQGVIEHLDDPWAELVQILKKHLVKGGHACISVPNWTNPRGLVYHACRVLYGAKMSLTDLHWILPNDFNKFVANHTRYEIITFASTDYGLATGKDMMDDFTDRLPKALGAEQNGMQPHIDKFMEFLEDFMMNWQVVYANTPQLAGASLGALIKKK